MHGSVPRWRCGARQGYSNALQSRGNVLYRIAKAPPREAEVKLGKTKQRKGKAM